MNNFNLDFSQTCRCCSRRDLRGMQNSLELHSLYTYPKDANSRLSIAEIIAATTPKIEINASDGLPQLICERCLKKLLEIQKFQEMCQISDKNFRKQIKEKQTTTKPSCSMSITESEFDNILLKNPLSTENTEKNVSSEKSIEKNMNTKNVPSAPHAGISSSSMPKNKPIIYEIDESDDDVDRRNAQQSIRYANDRIFTCKHCGATFSLLKMYNDHKEIHEDNQNNPEYWERCFVQTEKLRHHMFIPHAIPTQIRTQSQPQSQPQSQSQPQTQSQPSTQSLQDKSHRRGGRKVRIRRLRAQLRGQSHLSDAEIERRIEEQDRQNQRNVEQQRQQQQQQHPLKLIPVRITNIEGDGRINRKSSFPANRR